MLFAIAYGTGVVVFKKASGRIVVGDAVHYYVYLRSAVFDRDLNFRNDYIRLYGLEEPLPADADWLDSPTVTGHVRNYMSVGPALVWAPGFLAVSGAIVVAREMGSTEAVDGYGRWFQASAGFSGIVAATVGAWLVWLALARLYDASAAIWAVLAVWLGSSALYYSLVSPTYSHASSMLALGAVFCYWVVTAASNTPRRYFVIGLLIGFASLVRWQDVVFALLPLIGVLADTGRSRDWKAGLTRLCACALGVVIGFLPQLAVWMVLYGRPFVVPQGYDWMRWSDPRVLELLFSNQHGLLSWTPVILLTLVGLWWAREKDPVLAGACGVIFLVSLYVNAAVPDWWAGEAFGARRFTSCFSIFALGMAAFVARLRERPAVIRTLCAALVVLNFALLLQYQLFMRGVQPLIGYPENAFTAPSALARWMWAR